MKNMLLTKDLLIGSQAGTHAVYAMEQRFNSYFENKMMSLGMCNATMALMSVFVTLELKPGDKILTTSYTWGGTIAGALFMGLNIVFADINPNTLTLSPVSVKNQLDKHRDIKVILDVDIFGNPSLSDEINQIAKQYKCFHLIDSASGFGSMFKGKPSGFYADAVVYSFSESKSINIGEGAVLLVQDFDFYEKLIFYTQHPNRAKRDAPIFFPNQFALNFRIHPLAAYILNTNFDEELNQINQRRVTVLSFMSHFESYSGYILFNNYLTHLPSFTRVCFQLDISQREKIAQFVKEYYKAVEIEKPSISILLYNDPVLERLGYSKQLLFDESIIFASIQLNKSIEINFKY
jgi:perosamine synthetase